VTAKANPVLLMLAAEEGRRRIVSGLGNGHECAQRTPMIPAVGPLRVRSYSQHSVDILVHLMEMEQKREMAFMARFDGYRALIAGSRSASGVKI